jgi:serine/threonine protein phosphatase PrpC
MLVLACDGLWDVMTNEETATIIRGIFNDGGNEMAMIAEELLDVALQKGRLRT